MYTLMKGLPVATTVSRQAPALAASIGVAELFYRFHSFTLECAAFLATWWLLDAARCLIADRGMGPRDHGSRTEVLPWR